MKYVVIATRDIATNCFDRPFVVPHKGHAVRGFTDAINDPSSNIGKHPEDYELYELGTFDDGTGLFETGVPVQIVSGKAVYVPKN